MVINNTETPSPYHFSVGFNSSKQIISILSSGLRTLQEGIEILPPVISLRNLLCPAENFSPTAVDAVESFSEFITKNIIFHTSAFLFSTLQRRQMSIKTVNYKNFLESLVR